MSKKVAKRRKLAPVTAVFPTLRLGPLRYHTFRNRRRYYLVEARVCKGHRRSKAGTDETSTPQIYNCTSARKETYPYWLVTGLCCPYVA